MNLSKQTVDILKNFSTINASIAVDVGNTLQTMSAMKNILVKSTVEETFNTEFAIYDLSEFLNLSTSETFIGANFGFNNDYVDISKDRATSRYYYADRSTIITPSKSITMPEAEIESELKQDDLSTIRNMSSVLAKPDVVVRGDANSMILSVLDKKDPTSNVFNLDVGDGNGDTFEMYFKGENLKLLRGDYTVKISSQAISEFIHNDIDLTYWIALEPDSNYGE